MFNRIALLHLSPGLAAAEHDRLVSALREACEGRCESLVQPVLPGSFNGGDLLWRTRYEDEAHYQSCAAWPSWQEACETLLGNPQVVAHVDGATFEDGDGGGHWSGSGVYRALLLSIKEPASSDSRIKRFENELLAMPRHISSIRAWRLSRVCDATGSRRWSLVWEQEYADVQGLTGPYMLHPYHWAVVDRWFDPESTDWIVDSRLCHSFCRI